MQVGVLPRRSVKAASGQRTRLAVRRALLSCVCLVLVSACELELRRRSSVVTYHHHHASSKSAPRPSRLGRSGARCSLCAGQAQLQDQALQRTLHLL